MESLFINDKDLIKKLKSYKNPKNVEGMARFGINPKYALGINIPILRKLAKEINHYHNGKDPTNMKDRHLLAGKLWKSKIHEARILASMIDLPELVTEKQMDSWISDFNSWDLCDQTCINLFWKQPLAYKKAIEWTKRNPEFEKRAGFALMAVLAWHDKNAADKKFKNFFPYIEKYSTDERNYIKKAVNWALRQIGKRNIDLRKKSINIANRLITRYPDSKSANWIAKDAIRELSSK